VNTWFRDRRVVVIGGFGFIGSNLTERLVALGAAVTVVTPAVDRHRTAADQAAQRGVRVMEGDLRDVGGMSAAVAGNDVVFNLAGQSGAARSMEDPWTDLDVNCRGNLALLEAVRRVNPRTKLVFASSRLAYGRTGADPAGEDRLVDPLCIHAVHKLAVEQYLKIYGSTYGLSWTSARLTNPYGPGQPQGRTAYGVVNHMIHQALLGETIRVYGDGRQQRDYIYIDDAVEALLAMAAAPQSAGRIYNVGSGIATAFIDMARAITAATGGRGQIEFVDWPPLAGQIETGDFVADIARIQAELQWRPAVPLADGLSRTIAFYRAHTG
jgi:UDP-glucose 4-epimerase